MMISGSFDGFSCRGVSVEGFLVGLHTRVCVFTGVCVCHVRQWRLQRLLDKSKPVLVIHYQGSDGKTWGFC